MNRLIVNLIFILFLVPVARAQVPEETADQGAQVRILNLIGIYEEMRFSLGSGMVGNLAPGNVSSFQTMKPGVAALRVINNYTKEEVLVSEIQIPSNGFLTVALVGAPSSPLKPQALSLFDGEKPKKASAPNDKPSFCTLLFLNGDDLNTVTATISSEGQRRELVMAPGERQLVKDWPLGTMKTSAWYKAIGSQEKVSLQMLLFSPTEPALYYCIVYREPTPGAITQILYFSGNADGRLGTSPEERL